MQSFARVGGPAELAGVCFAPSDGAGTGTELRTVTTLAIPAILRDHVDVYQAEHVLSVKRLVAQLTNRDRPALPERFQQWFNEIGEMSPNELFWRLKHLEGHLDGLPQAQLTGDLQELKCEVTNSLSRMQLPTTSTMCEIRLQGPAEISRECTKRIMKFAREVALEEMLKGIPRHLVDVTSGENVLIRNHDSQCTVDTGIGVTPDIIELVKRLTRAEGLIPRDLLPPKEG